MGKKRTIEEKKHDNAPFLAAFDWLADYRNITAGELASQIGVDGSNISRYRSGLKGISRDTKLKLGMAYGGRLNMHFLYGDSQHMFLDDVPDAEILQYSRGEKPTPHETIPPIQQQETSPTPPADNMMELYARMIRGVDDLRVDLRAELSQVRQLREELQQTVNTLRQELRRLQQSSYGIAADAPGQYTTQPSPIPTDK